MSRPARLLDVHVDWDHHRSVYTLVGSADELVRRSSPASAARVTGSTSAATRARIRTHRRRRRVALVPLTSEDESRAREAALTLANRIADELELPVFFYGRLTEDGREPAFFRRGGTEELQGRIDSGELAPDRGPGRLHPAPAVSCSGCGGR